MGAEASTYQQLRSYLAYLKLTAAAEQLAAALEHALEHAERVKPSYTQFLHDLLDVEVTATEQRRLDGRLRLAGFPSTKTLEQFDFDAQPALDRRLVDELATLRFIEERANVLAIGPPGVGKTMLAIALGLKAVHAGYRVYYTTAADLVARTARAAIDGRWQTTMRFWNGPQLLDQPPLPARLDHPDDQQRHRELGRDLRRHHRRRRDPRPPPAPRHRPPDRRRVLPHARPPRPPRATPKRPQPHPPGWGILVITTGEFS